MDGFIFVKGFDSYGNDFCKKDIILDDEGNISNLEEIKNEAIQSVCFNTLGYFKNSVDKIIDISSFGEKHGFYIKDILYNFPIKIVNLDRRTDRWEAMQNKLKEAGIEKYERFSATDGSKLQPSEELNYLFRNNDFQMRQGVVGCALSHITLWKELLKSESDYFIILEDDIDLNPNFKAYLNLTLRKLINEPYIDLLYLGYFSRKEKENGDLNFLKFQSNEYLGGTFGYIISKSGVAKLLNIVKYKGVQDGIDTFMSKCFEHLSVYKINKELVTSDFVNHRDPNDTTDSDVTRNIKPIGFNNKLVKVICDWLPSREFSKYLCKYTKTGTDSWDDIQISSLNYADYYIIINKPMNDDEYYEPHKTILFQMEPWVKDETKNWGVKTWGKWSQPESLGLYKVLTHKYHHNPLEWHINKTYNELLTYRPIKFNTLSVITSDKNTDEGHIKRLNFLKYFEKHNKHNLDIDIYGRGKHSFKNYKGSLEYKDDGLAPYKYTICIENNSEHNYITEKLVDGIMSDCVCFYWGCPNVDDYIDPRAIIKIDLDNFEKSYQIIYEAIKNNEWKKKIDYIRAAKLKILNELQIIKCIENAIN